MSSDEIVFLDKVLERLRGYGCGGHKQLEKMILNRQKELKRSAVLDDKILVGLSKLGKSMCDERKRKEEKLAEEIKKHSKIKGRT